MSKERTTAARKHPQADSASLCSWLSDCKEDMCGISVKGQQGESAALQRDGSFRHSTGKLNKSC